MVNDERNCNTCVYQTRYGCASWDCEYIDREEAIRAWREKPKRGKWIDWSDCLPSAYGEDVVDDTPLWNFECSNCHNHIFDKPTRFCPNCGADMRGDNNETD